MTAERMVTINGQTFTLMPTVPASAIAALVNTAIALSNTIFPSNLSDYDTNTSSFAPSVNITLASASLPSLSVCNKFKFKAYMAMNGPSHMSID